MTRSMLLATTGRGVSAAVRGIAARRGVPRSASSSNASAKLSKEARRALRKERTLAGESKVSKAPNWGWLALGGVTGGVGLISFAASPYGRETAVGKAIVESYAWRWLVLQLETMSAPLFKPAYTKLLPDWPYFPNIPPDVPCPPTLVIDVEGTLCTSTWDPKYGWRHAKRPGADRFIKEMARYYELVFFSNNIAGVGDPIMASLDKDFVTPHKLFRESTTFHQGAYVKDLSHLNRDMKKVLLIDDDPLAFQFQPENAIQIKPYTDAYDRDDTVLEDLIPFLAAMVNEGVTDFPAVLRNFRSKDAGEIANSYSNLLSSVKQRQEEATTRGLGGLLRNLSPQDMNRLAMPEDQVKIDLSQGAAKASVQAPRNEPSVVRRPLESDRKGRLWQRYDGLMKAQEAEQRKKMEAFHEVMMKKGKEKKEGEERDD
uniref:Mitochondrial import inner membrane translocase subunit TIM50 n=1 Tax=Rhizochromulina marina TaxID=1034831 RepID=A0A7S2WSD5_9STRA|mmetsp:Transcript_32877/g.95122  ORF Transcript_32877/g.95122 Transcript_32877/m.95122 type:complete len:429 (+) Transcript_32877:1-1287(+)